MDHLGLIAGMVDELGIVDVIDDAISQDHEKRYLLPFLTPHLLKSIFFHNASQEAK